MSEQNWIDVAHLGLAVAALTFAVWAMIKMNEKVFAGQIVRAVGLLLVAAASVGIAVLAALLAIL